jgi:hypothetical protein
MVGTLTDMATKRRRNPGTGALVLAIAAMACAASLAAQADRDVTDTSRPLRLLRRWEETVKVSGGAETPRRVQVLFDYDKGLGYEAYSTLDGEPLGSKTLGFGHPAPSPVEIEEAFQIVRDDPEFALIFKRFRVVFEGGFVLAEGRGRPCGPGSRCLRVFLLSSDRAGTIRQVVVDLVKQRVAYDDFAPGAASGRAR